MQSSFPILSLITFTPLVGAIIVLLLPRDRSNLIRWFALAVSLVTFGLSLVMLGMFDASNPDLQLVERVTWIQVGDWTIEYHPPIHSR